MFTNAFVRIRRTRQVGLAGVIGHVPNLFDKLIDARVITTVARSGNLRSTVQNVLDREVNVVALSLAGNLDPIGETAECTVSPARTAVLRNVLIEGVRQVGYTIHVSPGKRIGESGGIEVRMRQRELIVVKDGMSFQALSYRRKEIHSVRSQRDVHA